MGFSEANFWEKVKGYASVIGCKPLCLAFKLFYAMQNPATPRWAKTVITSALAYFILPLDSIPDFLPGAGYADDLGALTLAVATVAAYIDDAAVDKSRDQVRRFFKACEC